MNYYAISDIHGYLNELKECMKIVDLKKNSENKLIFLGDYIEYGEKSCEVLYYIKDLTEKYKGQVVALIGNHEEIFLEWLFHPIEAIHWLREDRDLKTIKTFITKKQYNDVFSKLKISSDIFLISKLLATIIRENHKELITWIRKLPYYFETDNQIYVHAGIEEEAKDIWKYGTPEEYFANKFPVQKGHFYKDIIAGHVGTSGIRKNKNCNEVYWDGKSHYYIDGSVQESGFIPILKYDTKTSIYTSFRKNEKNNILEEYIIKEG